MGNKPSSKPRRYADFPAYYCQVGEKPQSDDAYFEKMAIIVFRSGLNWSVIEKKWPAFIEAFAQFSIHKVADFDVPDIDRLMENEGIVRNYKKITGTIKNAREFLAIQKEQGSFENYLNEISKDGEVKLCNTIGKRFAHIGKSTSMMFLRSVGLDMPEMSRYWMEKQGML